MQLCAAMARPVLKLAQVSLHSIPVCSVDIPRLLRSRCMDVKKGPISHSTKAALFTVIYFKNLFHTRSVPDLTPAGMWYGDISESFCFYVWVYRMPKLSACAFTISLRAHNSLVCVPSTAYLLAPGSIIAGVEELFTELLFPNSLIMQLTVDSLFEKSLFIHKHAPLCYYLLF